MITWHTFARGSDGRCAYSWGSGPNRVRCGNAKDRHSGAIEDHGFVPGRNGRCDYSWYVHGSGTERETCNHAEAIHTYWAPPIARHLAEEVGSTMPPLNLSDEIRDIIHHGLNAVSGSRVSWHANLEPDMASDILEAVNKEFAKHGSSTIERQGVKMTIHEPLKSHEATKRVLFHVVNSYQTWRNQLGIPNEFTDGAVRVGEQHLREVDWFPEGVGWLANNTDASPVSPKLHNDVLDLIDAELRRLGDTHNLGGRKSWREGVLTARETAARELQKIRDAYVVEALTRETEALRLYGIKEGTNG